MTTLEPLRNVVVAQTKLREALGAAIEELAPQIEQILQIERSQTP